MLLMVWSPPARVPRLVWARSPSGSVATLPWARNRSRRLQMERPLSRSVSGQRRAAAVLCGQGGNQGSPEKPGRSLGPGLEHEEPDEVKLGHDLDLAFAPSSVAASFGRTELARSGQGANKSDGPRRSSWGHRCWGRGYLPFLSFLSFFLPAKLVS